MQVFLFRGFLVKHCILGGKYLNIRNPLSNSPFKYLLSLKGSLLNIRASNTLQSVFNMCCWIHSTQKTHQTWQITRSSSVVFNLELVAVVNRILLWVEFKVELTLSIIFFTDFIKPQLDHGHNKNRYKTHATFNTWRANTINKVDDVLNVPHTKITEELGLPVRNVMTKVFDGQLQVRIKKKMCVR